MQGNYGPSVLRGEGFAGRGRHATVFRGTSTDDTVVRRGDFAKWIRRLDKPAAILAAD